MGMHPSDLYFRLQDDGALTASATPGRRAAALAFALLVLLAAPLVWATSDAVATGGPKATLASDGDDDSGSGDDDTDTTTTGTGTRTGTRTRSRDATNTDGKTGVSTRVTATRSNTATRTGKTGVSTKTPTATASNSATNTGKTGRSTAGGR